MASNEPRFRVGRRFAVSLPTPAYSRQSQGAMHEAPVELDKRLAATRCTQHRVRQLPEAPRAQPKGRYRGQTDDHDQCHHHAVLDGGRAVFAAEKIPDAVHGRHTFQTRRFGRGVKHVCFDVKVEFVRGKIRSESCCGQTGAGKNKTCPTDCTTPFHRPQNGWPYFLMHTVLT